MHMFHVYICIYIIRIYNEDTYVSTNASKKDNPRAAQVLEMFVCIDLSIYHPSIHLSTLYTHTHTHIVCIYIYIHN
jgi:hypothetical protein